MHKKVCKQRAAELRDEALFKDPPPKEDCPICFLPMPTKLISCISFPPATIFSVPIRDHAEANKELASFATEQYYACCGKHICGGCIHSLFNSGINGKCPFCNADQGKTEVEQVKELMKRVEANDAAAMTALGSYYNHGKLGLHQDIKKTIELWTHAAELGSSSAHLNLGNEYHNGGDLKKAKFHYEAAAIAGHEGARYNLGTYEYQSGNLERALKHWTIAASAGHHRAMYNLQLLLNRGLVSTDAFDSILTAYNYSCAEMRSKARDEYIDIMGTPL
jgi:TPR repeat protein